MAGTGGPTCTPPLMPFSVIGYRLSVKKIGIIKKLKLKLVALETAAPEPLALSKQ